MGFSVPIDRWLRGPLRPWAESLVLSDSLGRDGWLDAAAVGRAWTALQDNRRPAGAGLWAVIMLQAWRERWQV
jgi:asparagine synthase (glutamine-hydrolysing)